MSLEEYFPRPWILKTKERNQETRANIPRNSNFTGKSLNESFQSRILESSHQKGILDYLNRFFL
uniref:Putative ovule protein n=1 Tax=Solanum chacoense TaxID=4108 RepID=A0A0V0GVR5_SOLCH